MAGLVPFNRKNTSLIGSGFDDFYNLLDDFFTHPRRTFVADTFKVDVQENEKGYIIEAELPGVKKEEIEVSLNEGRLGISIERREDIEEEKKNYIHKERRYSSMNRCIYLKDASGEDVKAKLDEGVLSIAVPKLEKKETSVRVDVE